MADFINLTLDNIDNEHLCCIIRSKALHPGVEEKRKWLKERLKEGHAFRKLDAKATVFVEYAPLEKAWVPIEGSNYYYIYCLWVLGDFKGKGYGKTYYSSYSKGRNTGFKSRRLCISYGSYLYRP